MTTVSSSPGTLETGDSLVEFRRAVHRDPELRFEEHRTAKLIATRLRHAGFDVRTGIAGTGVVATMAGRSESPHVMLRAEMDAVPTPDLKTVPYASQVDGVAHACGHDVHMAVVVGAGESLAKVEPLLGRLTLLFQPAEEIPFGGESGARAMIENGVLDHPRTDIVLGLHCWPTLRAGEIGLDRDIAMAAKDAFRIRITGAGAHAATPSRGRDAIMAISQLVTSLHHLLAREIDPGELAALNVGTIQGGASQSIVPAAAEITGTLRTVDPEVRTRLRSSVDRLARGAALLANVDYELEWANEMPPVRNSGALLQRAMDILPGLVGVDGARLLESPPMTADDFALYAERVPSLYLKLGVCGSAEEAPWPALHDGHFDVDERAIDTGVAALSGLAADLLQRPVNWSDADGSVRA